MSIRINSNIIQNQQAYEQKVTKKYSDNSILQTNKKINNRANVASKKINNMRPNELKSFLNETEIKVLDEVFGSTNRNKILPKYRTSDNVSLIKGSKIDIEL